MLRWMSRTRRKKMLKEVDVENHFVRACAVEMHNGQVTRAILCGNLQAKWTTSGGQRFVRACAVETARFHEVPGNHFRKEHCQKS